MNEFLSLPQNYKKKIEEIWAEDINVYLGNLKSNKNNSYRILSSLFDFTYRNNITGDIKKDIIDPEEIVRKTHSIAEEDCKKIVNFINDEKNKLNDRLLIGLAYYTGLQIKRILSLKK